MLDKKRLENTLLVTPLVIFLLIFLGFPSIVDIIYSVSDVTFTTLRNPTLSGFDHYLNVLTDSDFWQASWFSLRFGLITAFLECGIGLALAIFLTPLLEKRPWLIALLMMPIMVAPAMIGLMYRLMLHEFVGPLPYYLWQWLGDSPAFLGSNWVFSTLIIIETLQWTPFALLLFYMAYQMIPQTVREAASIDGANAMQQLYFVELPIMYPTLVLAFFIRFIDGFRVFDNIYVLTGSGAGGSTTSLSIYIYWAFFKSGSIGKAIAASLLLFVISFALMRFISYLQRLREKA